MVLVFSFDENFVQHFLVAINSILDTNRTADLKIFVLNKDISDKSKVTINQNIAPYQVVVTFIEVNLDKFRGLLVSDRITIDTYFRLAIPALLDPRINRAIYLDCDIIVLGSLRPLWEMDLQNKAFAAVPEYSNARNREMGLGETKTFNAGVMVIDVDKWRREKISERVFTYLAEHPENIKFHDQDALNGALINEILEIPLKWNVTTPFVRLRPGDSQALYESADKPVIIHFNEVVKPWHYRLRHPFKSYYYKYLRRTPYKEFVPADRNIENILRKCLAVSLISLGIKRN